MHIEFLVEDKSGKEALDILAGKILGKSHTFRAHAYKGIERLPKGMKPDSDADKRILLDQLPRLLRGYGNTPGACVVVVCDLDDKDYEEFLGELGSVLEACSPKPETYFCIAIEEMEAWYLGDLEAIGKAYPYAKQDVLHRYRNDSICGTWELLADAVYKGGQRKLEALGWQSVGAEKSKWAIHICPHMDVTKNQSPSFNYFRSTLLELIN